MTFFFIGSPTGVNDANLYNLVKVVIVGLLFLSFIASASADEQEDLAKESQNPIGNIISTADWEADSDERWTVPFGGGVGRLVKFGKQPIDLKAQAFVNAVKPDGAMDWALQLKIKFLFPK